MKKNIPISLPAPFPRPERLSDVTSWQGHIPFAFVLTNLLRPRVLVELGTHKGDSFCAFRQAMVMAGLDGACHAVDTWEGDPQAGFYGPEILAELRDFVARRWSVGTELHQCRFDEALDRFADGSIDLLHIDGLHTYEAVKHDFETWRPKLSERAVVLFHDTQVFGRDFGVWRFWEEVRQGRPHLEFLHSHGLGVLGMGLDLPESVSALLAAEGEDVVRLRWVFAALGGIVAGGREPSVEEMASFDAVLAGARPVFDPERPKVSVVIPAYNHERYIRETIHSVLRQTETDFELLIVDDGSTDATAEVAASIADPRMSLFRQENRGAHAALNRGVELARGEWVAVLNSDDVWHSERLEALLAEAAAHSECAAVFSPVDCMDGDGAWLRTITNPSGESSGEISLRSLLADNFLTTTSNLFCRESVFGRVGRFAPYRYVHDWDFFLRLADVFSARMVARPLLSYRIHDANTIQESEAAANEESARMLLSFLMGFDVDRHFPGASPDEAMAALLADLGRKSLDRAMTVPLLFALRGRITLTDALESWAGDDSSRFREAVRRHFRDYADVWREGQNAWKRWEELNRRFADTERRLLAELEAERLLVAEKDRRLATALAERDQWWRESQTAWERWKETNDRLVEMDGKLAAALAEVDKWWKDSQTAWKKWEETNQRLIERVEEGSRLASERDALAARCGGLDARRVELESRVLELEALAEELLNSREYRLGTRLLAPARALRSAITPKE